MIKAWISYLRWLVVRLSPWRLSIPKGDPAIEAESNRIRAERRERSVARAEAAAKDIGVRIPSVPRPVSPTLRDRVRLTDEDVQRMTNMMRDSR